MIINNEKISNYIKNSDYYDLVNEGVPEEFINDLIYDIILKFNLSNKLNNLNEVIIKSIKNIIDDDDYLRDIELLSSIIIDNS